MKIGFWILGITAFLVWNIYHNGKYTKLVFQYKKYIQMGVVALMGVSLWLLLRRDPSKCKNILLYANNIVKYMPIDKSSMSMISPILDFTQQQQGPGFMYQSQVDPSQQQQQQQQQQVEQKATKRSVSETKKKYVASSQNWKCGKCHQQLNAWFEVDHKIRLEYGGSNEVQNLVALCRECHGRKTAMENM
jgi:cytochrome c553